MKQVFFLALAASVLGAGCATTQTAATASTANQTITLEQALETSAQTREKLLEAKQAYENAKLAAEVAAGKKTTAQAAQEVAQQKVDAAKKQLEDEKNAWLELIK